MKETILRNGEVAFLEDGTVVMNVDTMFDVIDKVKERALAEYDEDEDEIEFIPDDEDDDEYDEEDDIIIVNADDAEEDDEDDGKVQTAEEALQNIATLLVKLFGPSILDK